MKVLVLAGSFNQLELIKYLRKYYDDVEIILVDYLKYPVAKDYVDKFYRISTLDIEGIEKLARDEKVNIVITVCTDQALNTAAYVSQKLGLPCYIDANTGKNVTNKKYMKNIFELWKIPTARHIIVDETSVKLPKELDYPVVVKPVDCNSSKGVVKVCNADMYKMAVSKASEYSRANQVVVEEYKVGKEISVDAVVIEGNAKVLCISESQKIKSDTNFVICRTVYPANLSVQQEKEIENIAQKLANAFSLVNCPMLIQMLCTDEGLFVIEFSARTGGGLKYQLIDLVAGVNIFEVTVNMTLGNKIEIKSSNKRIYIIDEYLYCNEGVFSHVEGLEQLHREGIIYNYQIYKEQGAHIEKILSSGDRIASVTIISDTPEDLRRKYDEMKKKVKVFSDSGGDILYRKSMQLNYSI